MVPKKDTESGVYSDKLTIPELEQSKAAVLNTLASVHSRRSYEFAIDTFIAWYCSEPRLNIQSRCCCPVPIALGRSQPVGRYDQPASLCDPAAGR